MRQVLFEWHGVRIHSYPAMLYLGMTLALIVGNYASNMMGMASAPVFLASVLLSVPGLIGGRALFVACHWSEYRLEPRRIWRRSEGGGALQGGLLLAVLVSAPLLAVLRVPHGAFWDSATFGLLTWLIFGRLGCLLHGCCCGRPSEAPIALCLPDHRGVWCRRIPTQILEACWAAVLLLFAVGIRGRLPFPGALFLSALAAYGVGRSALQPARAAQERLGGINLQQALSAALVGLSLTGLLALWVVRGPSH
jgi:phosphatidylglycerol:prolipoprotein diacylglycerol transferase